MNKSLIRKLALVSMFVGDAVMLLGWWMAGQYIFFWVFVGINLIVVAGEIIATILTGKTLSTNVTKALEQYKAKRPWIYLALFGLGWAITSLIVHLGVW